MIKFCENDEIVRIFTACLLRQHKRKQEAFEREFERMFAMKKIKLFTVLLIVVTMLMTTVVSASTPPILDRATETTGEIRVLGEYIISPPPSVSGFGGVIMLPLRAIAEAAGLPVEWNGSERRVDIGNISIWIDKPIISRDNRQTTEDFGPAPVIIDGVTYVPISFFGFGLTDLAARIEAGIVIVEHRDNRSFSFGRGVNEPQPRTVDEFIPVFMGQFARYNAVAPLLWHDYAVVGKTVVLEDVDTNRLWLITTEGFEPITEEEAEEMGVNRLNRSDDFSFYEGGMYITISEESIREKIGSEKRHVGAYDSILWFTHEGFHKWEQDEKWNKPGRDNISNAEREEFFLDIPARAKRNLLQRQLMNAVANPDNPSLVLDALATYVDYKENYAEAHANTKHRDWIEGTALYFEVVSSLFIFYPNQVSSRADLAEALSYLAQYEDDYVAIGAVAESYTIGVFAGALLDRVDDGWQARTTQEPRLSPIEMLAIHYADEVLPEPKQLTSDEMEAITEDIRDKIRFLVERQVGILTGLKQSLDSLPEEEGAAYASFLATMMANFEEMIQILPEEEREAQAAFIDAMRQ
jgi:hypothetical protein